MAFIKQTGAIESFNKKRQKETKEIMKITLESFKVVVEVKKQKILFKRLKIIPKLKIEKEILKNY